MTDVPVCVRCGFDHAKRTMKRTMLYVPAREGGLIWVCDRCHAPREKILQMVKPQRRPVVAVGMEEA